MCDITYPNYRKCLTNLACSIMKHFGLKPNHSTLETLDLALSEKEYQNVIVLVYDGLGVDILKNNLSSNSLLRKHLVDEITSVFPSTTASATTSLLSGLNPVEHGWVGYDVYFEEIDQVVTVFTNKIKDTNEEVRENVSQKFLAYNSIIDMINNGGKYKAYDLRPFGNNHYKDLDDMNNKIIDLCKAKGKKYIYAYYSEPDMTLHNEGVSGQSVRSLIKNLNDSTEYLLNNVNNAIMIVVADHGLIDVEEISLRKDHVAFVNLLAKNTAMEGRACSFWVKKGNDKAFIAYFNRHFARDFILLSKEDIIKQRLFGDNLEHKNFRASIGDYIAIATGNKYFEYNYYEEKLRGHHAGITKAEMIVPLIILKK